MEGFFEHLSTLTKFTIAIGFAALLPKVMARCRLPPVLGFLAAGVLLGPNFTGMLSKEGPVINLFADLGKLLFMFFIGFEIDLDEFKKSRRRAMVFGAATFLLPFVGGAILGRMTGSDWNSAALLGSLIASHTLLAFPILQRLGITQHPVVTMVVGGTVFTDITSMLVLAITISIHTVGFSWKFLGVQLLELAVYVPFILFGAGLVARRAIIWFGDTAEVRLMIMLVVIALCAETAQLIQLEGIVGAFLAGIAVKQALRGKFAIEPLEVTSQALFIPAFFITTGFLINFKLLGSAIISHPGLVLGIIAALFIGKYLAAWLCTFVFTGTRTETDLVWSLSLPQMAATLASAVVAYKTVNSSGIRLLNEIYLNVVLVLVVATCVIGPILSQHYAGKLKKELAAAR